MEARGGQPEATSGSRVAALQADVVVCGGGPAGICAAIAAARSGAAVLLIEQYGFVGGMATAGLVNPIYGFGYFGPGNQLVTGIPEELVQVLGRVGGTLGHRRRIECGSCISPEACPTHGVTGLLSFDPEAFKHAALGMLHREGVDLLLYCRVLGPVIRNGALTGITVATKAGSQTIQASLVIDATGDGDVAAEAGAPFKVGRGDDGTVQPQSLMFRIAGVRRDDDRFVVKLTDIPGKKSPYRALLFRLPRAGEYVVNCDTGIHGANSLSPRDLTRVHSHALLSTADIAASIRAQVPGCEASYLVATATHLGIRESRRITGEYVLSKDDVLGGRKFADGICRAAFPIDIHDLMPGDTNPMFSVKCGDYYEIPYRCLVPREIDNLLVAGRCLSGTHEAHGSYRVMGTCMAVGQAAGTAAALAVARGVAPRHLDGALVRQTLIDSGVVLPPAGAFHDADVPGTL